MAKGSLQLWGKESAKGLPRSYCLLSTGLLHAQLCAIVCAQAETHPLRRVEEEQGPHCSGPWMV